MLTQIKITNTVVTSRYGALEPGTILRTDEAFARHLVEDCKAAKWIDASKPAADEQPAPKRSRKQVKG